MPRSRREAGTAHRIKRLKASAQEKPPAADILKKELRCKNVRKILFPKADFFQADRI